MTSNIQFYRSVKAGIKPDELLIGELALNLVDQRLFIGNGGDSKLLSNGATQTAPTGKGWKEYNLSALEQDSFTGTIENAAKLGGELPEYYLNLANHTGNLPASSLPGGTLKIILDQPKTLYVSPTGSNSNDGLSPSKPKTLQGAINTFVDGYVIDNFATIQLLEGTYQVSGLNVSGFQGNSQIRLVGNVSDPSTVIITNSPTASINADGGMWILLVAAANLAINGVTFKTSAHNTEENLNVINLIYSFIDSRLTVSNCVFDATYSYSSDPYLGAITCSTNTRTVLSGTINYKGTFNVINVVDGGSFIHNTGGATQTEITFGANTSFDTHVSLLNGAYWTKGDGIYTGSPTGKKFSISGNSILGSGGIDPNIAIAGTIAGSVNNWLGHPFNTVVTGGGGEANTASNADTSGLGIFKQKVGTDLVFKRLKEGNNVSLTEDADSITIDVTAVSGGLNTVDSNSLEFFGDGTSSSPLTASVKIDSSSTATVSITPQGLKVNAGSGDMAKSVYDTTNNGVVDNAEALNGQAASYYRDRANHTGTQNVSTITGLATVATSGSYLDLSDRPSSGTSAIAVSDEGTQLTASATSINFTGAGVTATNSGSAVTVNVSSSSSISFESNEETLSANKTLANTDAPYQYLDPGGANRDIVLPSSPTQHKFFRFRSTNGAYTLNFKEGATTLFSLGNSVNNGTGNETRLMADVHRTATRWIINLY